MKKSSKVVKSQVESVIINNYRCYSIDKISIMAGVSTMIISQAVSDLVYEGIIPLVFLNPNTRKYEELPVELANKVRAATKESDDNFRRVYSNMKKMAAKQVRLGLIESKPVEAEIPKQPDPKKVVIIVKRPWWKRLFGVE